MKQPGRIVFANQLRGIAALCVVLTHLNGVFWIHRDIISQFIGAPVLTIPTPVIVGWSNFRHFNVGVFGVALFFLISGFVIPFSIQKSGRATFLIARFFRIYPTYLTGLIVGLFFVFLTCAQWGTHFMWGIGTVLQNIFLVHTMFYTPSIDLVSWTLAIEVKFYIVICLMATSIRNGFVSPIIGFSIIVFLANRCMRTPLGTEMLFVTFMMMGVAINYLFRKKIGTLKFSICSAIVLASFFAGWSASPWPDAFWIVAPNYLYAMIIFGIAYATRERFRNIKLLDFIADISYPLYLTHSLVGYATMRYMISVGVHLRYIIPVTTLLIIIVSYAIHRFIELPTMQIGRKFGKWKGASPIPAAPPP